MQASPTPDAAWYVDTITPWTPIAACRGASARTSGIVEQFGLAMILDSGRSAMALRVDLGDNERAFRLHSKRRRLVDGEATRATASGTKSRAGLRSHREERDVRAGEIVIGEVANACVLSLTGSSVPAEFSEASRSKVTERGAALLEQVNEFSSDGARASHDGDRRAA